MSIRINVFNHEIVNFSINIWRVAGTEGEGIFIFSSRQTFATVFYVVLRSGLNNKF